MMVLRQKAAISQNHNLGGDHTELVKSFHILGFSVHVSV